MMKSKWMLLIALYLCKIPTSIQPSHVTKLPHHVLKEKIGFFRNNKYKIIITGVIIGISYGIFRYSRTNNKPQQKKRIIPPSRILYQITDEQYKQAVQRAWDKFPKKQNSSNKAKDFIGIEKMVNKLFEQLNLFETWKENNNRQGFYIQHYDWWVFPIPYISTQGGTKYATFGKDLKLIQESVYKGNIEKYKNWTYLKGQRRAMELVLWAIGFWDDDNKCITETISHIYSHERLAKILHGTLLANKEMYEIANALLAIIQKNNPNNYPKFANPYFTDIGLNNKE